METGVLVAIIASVGAIFVSLVTTFIVLRNSDKDNEANYKQKMNAKKASQEQEK